ncbi:MAG: DUF2203 domain-containing protein [Thermoplasmata archaeon]
MVEPTPSGGDHLPQPARFWSAEEANRRLDGLRELLPRLRSWVVRLRKVHGELDRLSTFWGSEVEASDHPDSILRARLVEEEATLRRKLEHELALLREEAIEVKDLESGLVDFYAIEEGEVVFLCWQTDEDDVAYFHTMEGGYRNRRPIPEGTDSGPRRSSHHPAR